VFTHILIPTDLTDRTEPTLALAVKMPRTSSTHFTLLHVVQTISAGSVDEFASFYQRLEKRARTQMVDLVRRTAGADAAGVKHEVVFGKPAEEIVRFAAAHRADLIVLAAHRIDVPGGHPDLGTVSYKVSFLAPCPILLVK